MADSERKPFSIVRCAHWNSSGMACKKGVHPVYVTDNFGRVPCVTIRGITGEIACDMRQMPEEPKPGEAGDAVKMLQLMLDRKCPRCGGAIAGEMEFNGSILALPCRHVLRSSRD